MAVIDAQVHLNRDIGVDAAIFAMDAVGIDAVLIDERSGFDSFIKGNGRPYTLLPNGAIRAEYPLAREAVRRYPGRFAYAGRIDPNDPEMRHLVQDIAANPHQVCVRMSPKPALGEVDALRDGHYDALLSELEAAGVPLMLWIPSGLNWVPRLAEKFSGLSIILDHCGVLPVPKEGPIDRDFLFRTTAELARFENVAVKLSHAPRLSQMPFPFVDLLPHIRRLVDSYGVSRVMWASDHTQTKRHHAWSEALMYLQVPGVLSDDEREWIFFRTARELLSWPVTEIFGLYREGVGRDGREN